MPECLFERDEGMDQGDLDGLHDFNEIHIKVIEDQRNKILILDGKPYMKWASEDELSQRIAIVQTYELGLACQEDIAKAFGTSVRSVYKYVQRYTARGADGLVKRKSGPKGSWKISPEVRSKILYLFLQEGIVEYKSIKERLEGWGEHVGIMSVRQVLIENGLVNEGSDVSELRDQGDLFNHQGDEQLSFSFDWHGESEQNSSEEKTGKKKDEAIAEEGRGAVFREVETRARRYYSRVQRIYLDQLEQGDYNAYAGALLFTPLLVQYPFLPTIEEVIDISAHERYGLEELCQTLFYFDVFGFHSLEDYKRAYPEEFGILIGRTHSPSRYTLRRFLHRVRKLKRSQELMEAFARMYLKTGIADWGVLYIDGHFLPYYGMYLITKGWHGVRKIPMKGSYNFLGVDANFRPWIFFIRSSSEDLLQKIPEMIERAKQIGSYVGLNEEQLKDLIVIFDREGYSGKLYSYLDGRDRDDGKRRVIFISWAKYAAKWVYDEPESRFNKSTIISYEIQEAEEISYFETERKMSKYGRIRAIVIERKSDRKRMVIYTNGTEEEIASERVVQLICRRWGEENLIKELLMKHFINYSPGYVREYLVEQPDVDNPKVKELKRQKANLVSALNKLKVKFADQVLQDVGDERNWDEIKKKDILLRMEIAKIDNEILFLDYELDKLPPKVAFEQTHKGRRLVKLNYEKKRFLDCIKVYTYNLEKKMCKLLSNYYDKPKEILPALSMIVERGGYVKLEKGMLKVMLRRFKNREIDYAARHLCEDINMMHPVTLDKHRLPIHFSVR